MELSHPPTTCERRLQALPNYDRFRCQPQEFICACGRRWVHVCDEAEGCFYAIGNPENWFEVQRPTRQVHLPTLLAEHFTISTSEARRCIALGGVRLGDQVIRSLDLPRHHLSGRILRLGKRRAVQL